MNAGAVIAAKQNRYMRRFQQAGATNPDRAQTLEEVGCGPSFVFNRLLDRGIFVEVSEGRYYIDAARAAEFRSHRRNVMLVVVGIAIVVVLVLMWVR